MPGTYQLLEVPTQNSLQYTLDTGYTAGGGTLTLNATLTGVIQAPGVCVVDRIDSSGNKTPTKREYFEFTGVSGQQLTGVTGGLAGSTNQDHSVGAIVEFTPDVIWAQSVRDHALQEHSVWGQHTSLASVTNIRTFNINALSIASLARAEINEFIGASQASLNFVNIKSSLAAPSAASIYVSKVAFNQVAATVSAVASGSNVLYFADGTAHPKDQPVATNANGTPFLFEQNQSMARQAIINSNFDIWQRGTSFTNPATATYSADRWRIAFINTGTLPTSIVHTRQALTTGDLPNSFYFYRVSPNGAGSGFGATDHYTLQHPIEHGVRFLCGNGKKVTLSFWARSSITNKKLGVFLAELYGTVGTPTAQENLTGTNWTLSTTWTKYTYTFTTNTLVGKTFGTANDDYIQLSFRLMWGSTSATVVGASGTETFVGSGDIDIAQVQLCAGDVALPFQPKSFEEELRSCMRYYQKSWEYETTPGTGVTAGATILGVGASVTGALYAMVYFKVPMRTIPTIHLYDTSGNIDKVYRGGANKSGTTDYITTKSFMGGATDTTAAVYFEFQWTAVAEL